MIAKTNISLTVNFNLKLKVVPIACITNSPEKLQLFQNYFCSVAFSPPSHIQFCNLLVLERVSKKCKDDKKCVIDKLLTSACMSVSVDSISYYFITFYRFQLFMAKI